MFLRWLKWTDEEFSLGRYQKCCDGCWIFRFGPKTKANYAWNHSYFSRTTPYTLTQCIQNSLWMNRCHLTHKLIHLTQPNIRISAGLDLLRHRLPYPPIICLFQCFVFVLHLQSFIGTHHTFTTNDVTIGDFLCDTCVLITKTPCFIQYHRLFSIWMTIFVTIFQMSICIEGQFQLIFRKNVSQTL